MFIAGTLAVVDAGVFLVFVREMHFLQEGMELAILLDEVIGLAAIESQGGAEIFGAFFCEGEGVVGAAAPVFAED